LENELSCAISKSADFKLDVENCLIKANKDVSDGFTTHSAIIWNENPLFDSIQNYDFRLKTNSPCKEKGKPTQIQYDITGAIRNNPPSIGAYE